MIFARIEALNDIDDAAFGCGDHLLVWAWRRIAYGQSKRASLGCEFAAMFGEEGAEVLATLQMFLHAPDVAHAYQLSVGMPGGFSLTREQRVMHLLSAAQLGEQFLFERSLDVLARVELRHDVAIAANALGKAFAHHGLRLSAPAVQAPMVCPQQALAS